MAGKKKRTLQFAFSFTELPYKIFYFMFYAGYMPLLLYLPVYFKYIGLNAVHVGLLNGIRPILQSTATPLLVMLGERFSSRKLLFIISCLVMIARVLIIFLFLRPRHQVCTVKYINESDYTVREMSHFIEHKLTKRSLVTEDWSWNWKDATNETINYAGPKERLYRAGRNLKSPPIASNGTAFVQKPSEGLNQTHPNGMTNVSSSNVSGSTMTPLTERTNNIRVEYHVVNDQDEVYRIFIALLILAILGDWFDATIFTLVDHSCVANLESESYGFVRLWGNVGWGLITPTIGFIMYHFHDEMCGKSVGSFHYLFFFFIGFAYVALLVGSHLDFSTIPTDNIARTIRSTLSNFQYGMFLFASSFSGFCNGFFLTFVNWFIDSLGGSALIMGIATGCKCYVDAVLFFLLAKIIDYFGHQATMNIGFLGHIAVFLIYFAIKEAWLVVIAETIHAIVYALMTSTCVSFLIYAAPAGSSPRMQGRVCISECPKGVV